MKEIIDKAIEGGLFEGTETEFNSISGTGDICFEGSYGTSYISKDTLFLMPKFWSSLGKAMGWSEDDGKWFTNTAYWPYQWHRFIDHLAEGKDADSFFKELLANH